MSWIGWIRPVARVARELRLIRHALTRLADAADRAYPVPAALPDAEEPPLEIANAPTDFGALFLVESALKRQLGRDPDPDELLRAYDGELEVLSRSRRGSA